jgi:hypothetical protein
MSEKETTECIWVIGGKCAGKVKAILLFSNQLKVPICEKHLQQHREIMTLNSAGRDIQEVMKMAPDEQHKAFMELSEEDRSKDIQ